ncbi:MAG: prepilin-type N-terminal cleavage/methylation domain-containing protein [Polyangiaceae bacterium]|nr:prepilin-type N-terminal cleavage/methylation domain-containing protein [Polyangiaceae bacterium]
MKRASRQLESGRASQRGMTLLEILVSLAILAMISLLIYGAFDSLSRGRKGEALRVDRARQGRDAMARITREIQSAFLSAHNPAMPALVTRTTAFIATHSNNGPNYDRLDFSAFAHVRMEKDAKESDQCEVGYFVVKDPDVDDKMDLVRREQTPIDLDPKRGGVINVLAENVESFHLRYFDPLSGMWVESWDTTQVSGQPNRLPLEVHVSLELKGVKNSPPFAFETKFMIPMLEPLSFGIPR